MENRDEKKEGEFAELDAARPDVGAGRDGLSGVGAVSAWPLAGSRTKFSKSVVVCTICPSASLTVSRARGSTSITASGPRPVGIVVVVALSLVGACEAIADVEEPTW